MSDTFQLHLTGALAISADAPVVSFDGALGKWTLREPLTVRMFGAKAVVPAEFPTDFASVPRIFKAAIPDALLFSAASVFHDRLYFLGVDKDLADAVFFVLMKHELRKWAEARAKAKGVARQVESYRLARSRILAWVMWQCVQWLGGFAYEEHRRRERAAR